jgi:hypothetical protein
VAAMLLPLIISKEKPMAVSISLGEVIIIVMLLIHMFMGKL